MEPAPGLGTSVDEELYDLRAGPREVSGSAKGPRDSADVLAG